jgi:hypothetical protein
LVTYLWLLAVVSAIVFLPIAGLCAMFVLHSYIVGFRDDALGLLWQNIDARTQEAECTRFEKNQLARLDRLQRRAERAAAESADTTKRDKALAVLAGREGDDEFIAWVKQRRCRYQRGRMYQLERLLANANGAGAVIDQHADWLQVVEWRLRARAVRDVGRPVWDTVQGRGVRMFSAVPLWLALVPLLICVLVGLAFHDADPFAVYGDAAATFAVVCAVAAWAPLLVGALNATFEGTPRAYVRLFYWSTAAAFALAALVLALIVLGVMEEFWQHGLATENEKLSRIHLSPRLAGVIGLLIFNGFAVVIGHGPVRDVLNPRLVAWQRVRAAGGVAALTSIVPINIWMWPSVLRGEIQYAPSWIRISTLACFAVGICQLLVSAGMRRA